MADGGHLGFGPLVKNAGVFARGRGGGGGVLFFYKLSLEVKSIVKTCHPDNGHGTLVFELTIVLLHVKRVGGVLQQYSG